MFDFNKLAFWRKKTEAPPYPQEFYIIDYSPSAQNAGIEDDENKIIMIHKGNQLTKRYEIKKVLYSEARHLALIERQVPGIDRTRKEQRFAVFSRINPSEIKYTKS